MDSNNLGTYSSLSEVLNAYPSGGLDGNYLTIGALRFTIGMTS
jgi:hypothetical protein